MTLIQRLKGLKKAKYVALLAAGMVVGGYGIASAAGPSGSPAVEGNHVTCTTNASGVCSYTFASAMPAAPDSVVLTPSIASGATAYSLAIVNGSLTATGGQVRASLASGAPDANAAITFNYELVGAATAPPPPTTTIPPTTTTPPGTGTLQLDPSAPPLVSADSPNNVSNFSATTATFSPPANAVIVVGAAINNYAPDQYYSTDSESVTNSGTPLVWTRQAGSTWPGSGSEGGSETWTATTGATAPGPISISLAASEELTSTHDWATLVTQVVTDSDGSAPVVGNHAAAAGNGSLPSATLSLSPGSLGFAAVSDWSTNQGASAFGPGLTAVNNGASPSLDNDGPDYVWHYFRSTTGSAGGSTTFNMTAPSPQTWNETVVEVKV